MRVTDDARDARADVPVGIIDFVAQLDGTFAGQGAFRIPDDPVIERAVAETLVPFPGMNPGGRAGGIDLVKKLAQIEGGYFRPDLGREILDRAPFHQVRPADDLV